MRGARIIAPLLAACLLLTGLTACHQHKWMDATCTQPETCAVCGKKRGEAAGHSWEDATCTQPKTCAVCEETKGEALGHQLSEATCTQGPVCSVCGEEVGKALGHKPGQASHTQAAVCTVCGEEVGGMLPYAEEFKLAFVKDREFRSPMYAYLSQGGVNIDDSRRMKDQEGYTITAEDGIYRLGNVTRSGPDGDGNVQVTIPYTFECKVRVVYDGVKNGGDFSAWWQYDTFGLFDYYSGSTVPIESDEGDSGAVTTSAEFHFDGKTVPVRCVQENQLISSDGTDWSSVGGGGSESFMISKSAYTLTVTVPQDYDGLCLYLSKLGLHERIDFDQANAGLKSVPLLEAMDQGETAGDLYLLRVKDLVG